MQRSIAIKAERTTGDCWTPLLQPSSIPSSPTLIQNEVSIVPLLVELPSRLPSKVGVLEGADDGVLINEGCHWSLTFQEAGAKVLCVRLFQSEGGGV
jgi:hypothetical protein